MDKLTLAFLAVTVIAVLVLFRRSKAGAVGVHEGALVRRCFGDQEKAERLIDLELRRNPRLSRENAARDAIQSLARDNR